MHDFDALIGTLRHAPGQPRRSMRRAYGLAVAGMCVLVASAGLAVLDALELPIRADYLSAITSPAVAAKQLLPLLLFFAAAPLTVLLMRPEASVGRWLYGAAVSLAVLPLLALVTLFNLPMDHWLTTIKGQSLVQCVVTIPSLATGLLLAQFIAMRQGAVTQPILAGVLAGVTAGALSAMIYAMICADDSPGFYGFWYTGGILISAAIGGLSGRYALRW
jgi:hypothetical protein